VGHDGILPQVGDEFTIMAALGGVLVLFGLGLVWAASAATEKVKAPVLSPSTTTA